MFSFGILLAVLLVVLSCCSNTRTQFAYESAEDNVDSCLYKGFLISDIMDPVYRTVPLYPLFILAEEGDLKRLSISDTCNALLGIIVSPLNIDSYSNRRNTINGTNGKKYHYRFGSIVLDGPCSDELLISPDKTYERNLTFVDGSRVVKLCVLTSEEYVDSAYFQDEE